MRAKNILVIQLRQLGDILLTSPCFRAIKNDNPDHRLTFLSHPMGRAIADGSSYIDEHLTYDEGNISSQLKLLAKLKRKNFDIVFDFMANPRSALFSFATLAPKRLAFSSSRNLFFTDTVPRSQQSDYIVREKFRLLEHIGVQCHDEQLSCPWNESHLGPANAFFDKLQLPKSSLKVTLSPTHRRPVRKWDVKKYVELADYLCEEKKASVIWLWGPGEEEEIDACIKACRSKTYKGPKTTLKELTAFLSKCDFFIGNSNGPSHFAVASGISTLQLHGHTQARAWCPMTEKHKAIQSPDGTMSSISLEEVKSMIDTFQLFA